MPKVKRPRIAGPAYEDQDRKEAPAPRPAVRARDVPYSVAWFRDRVATYALGTIVCGAAMLTIAAWMGGSLGAFGQRMHSGFNVIAGWTGLSVQDVHVNYELDPVLAERIRKASEVSVGENMLAADPYAIRDRIEKLDIGPVSVQRLWPDRIDIHVDQRKPIALWQDNPNGGAWRVVDQSGRAFAQADLAKYSGLPHIIGADAADAASALMAAVAQFPNLAERLDTAYRVGGRRWDIKFKGRADVVVFPADAQLMKALECVNLEHAQTRLLDLPILRIDARNPCLLAIQPMPGAPESSPLPGGA
jgi:cell division protein FtsQ